MGWRDALGAEDVVEPMPVVLPLEKRPTEKEDAEPMVAPVMITPIKKMCHCLHGQWCRDLVAINDRQICNRAGLPIFNMEACPFGNWFAAKQ